MGAILDLPCLSFCNSVIIFVSAQYLENKWTEFNGAKAYEETSTDEKSVVNSHSNNLPYKFAVNVKENQDKLPTMYWLPKLHKRPY